MGENNIDLSGGKLFITNPETGESRELAPGVSASCTISLKGEVNTPDRRVLTKPAEVDYTFTSESFAFMWERVKGRKRCIKLLMSMGFQRNTAHDIATQINNSEYTYSSYIWLLRVMGY